MRREFIKKSLILVALGILTGFLARWVLGPPASEDHSNRQFINEIDTSEVDASLLFEHELEVDPLSDREVQ